MHAPSVKARRLTLLVLCYVSLDLSSPFVPGAFNFNPDESVDGVCRHHEDAAHGFTAARDTSPLARVETRPAVHPPASTIASAGRPRFLNRWPVDLRRAQAPLRTASSLSDEH